MKGGRGLPPGLRAVGSVSTSDVCCCCAMPLPYLRIADNMWAARCSFVARLPDPASFLLQCNASRPPPTWASAHSGPWATSASRCSSGSFLTPRRSSLTCSPQPLLPAASCPSPGGTVASLTPRRRPLAPCRRGHPPALPRRPTVLWRRLRLHGPRVLP